MSIDQYSTTPANNDLTNYFKTGMRPSTVKNAGWDIMADIASYIVSLPTAAGTANALTVANGRPFATLGAGLLQVLNPASANTGPATFAPDGLTAKSIFANGAILAGGELQAGVPALLKYDGTQWNLLNPNPPGKNFFVDPCCRVAQIGAVGVPLTTSYKYGSVDLVQCKASGTAVSAGTITQDTANTMGSAGQYACKIAGATITGAGKVFFRRWIENLDDLALAGRNIIINVLCRQDTGNPVNAFLSINYANAVNNFSSVTNVGTSSAVSVPSGITTPVTYAVALPAGAWTGIEIILELDCGAVTNNNFYATDWQCCIKTLAQTCMVPRFEDDYAAALRYYEKSYGYGTAPGTATTVNARSFVCAGNYGASGALSFFKSFFKSEKIAPPTVSFYSPNSGSSGNIYDLTTALDKAVISNAETNGCYPTNNGVTESDGDTVLMHWVADARL